MQQDDPQPQTSQEPRETAIASVMTSTSMHKHPTAFFNTRLPVLQVALNVEAISAHFEPLLAPLASQGQPPSVTYARLLAYKKGNRGLIHYEVSANQGERSVVFGKLYPEPSQAMRAYETMQSLWEAFVSNQSVGIPQPLGVVPELSMLVYLPAEGEFLDMAITGEQAPHYMNLAAQWLATLHQQRLPLSRRFSLNTEIANVQIWATMVGDAYPDQADAAARIMTFMNERAAQLTLDTQTPIHKDFHYGHILIDESRPRMLNVIDFDEMRLGDPNFDLAHFCTNLHLLAYRKKNALGEFNTLQSAFLTAYSQQTGWKPNECFVYFYAYTCLKIAKQLCSMRGLRPRPEGEDQHQQVALILEQGLGALPYDGSGKYAGKFATLIMR